MHQIKNMIPKFKPPKNIAKNLSIDIEDEIQYFTSFKTKKYILISKTGNLYHLLCFRNGSYDIEIFDYNPSIEVDTTSNLLILTNKNKTITSKYNIKDYEKKFFEKR